MLLGEAFFRGRLICFGRFYLSLRRDYDALCCVYRSLTIASLSQSLDCKGGSRCACSHVELRLNLAEDVILHLSVLFVPGVWAVSRTIIFSFLESLLEFFVHLGSDVEVLLAL